MAPASWWLLLLLPLQGEARHHKGYPEHSHETPHRECVSEVALQVTEMPASALYAHSLQRQGRLTREQPCAWSKWKEIWQLELKIVCTLRCLSHIL
mmetsp:Transcript_94292/g.172839  ORF Transcript_94292/g.172839 Transcript_94292/m.172839 type:complete len:96 (+) Transcript_94292:611-898(+)